METATLTTLPAKIPATTTGWKCLRSQRAAAHAARPANALPINANVPAAEAATVPGLVKLWHLPAAAALASHTVPARRQANAAALWGNANAPKGRWFLEL